MACFYIANNGFCLFKQLKKKLGEEKYLETQENYINSNFSVHEVLQEHSHTTELCMLCVLSRLYRGVESSCNIWAS